MYQNSSHWRYAVAQSPSHKGKGEWGARPVQDPSCVGAKEEPISISGDRLGGRAETIRGYMDVVGDAARVFLSTAHIWAGFGRKWWMLTKRGIGEICLMKKARNRRDSTWANQALPSARSPKASARLRYPSPRVFLPCLLYDLSTTSTTTTL